jgi:phosphomannomutase
VIAPTLRAEAEAWMALDPDDDDRAELQALLDAGTPEAEAELVNRFDGRLRFGTAGLRAPMGAGPRRMNRVVVRQTAAGLMRWLDSYATTEPVVVIGYDARARSADFALDTARVVAAGGGWARVLPGPLPTPVLAYAIRRLGADAGVMCTASHNPGDDNGYKVYLGDGAQIVPPVDAGIARLVDAVVREGGQVALADPDDPNIEHVGTEIVDDYAAHVDARAQRAPGPLRIAYTPMHGVAGALATGRFKAAGYDDVHVVAQQADPDPSFPTLPFPNPEEPGALDLAEALADEIGADIILANDPDGDRLGVAVPEGDQPSAGGPTSAGGRTGRWRSLSGNEIGALLADDLLARSGSPDRLVVTTVVSSRLVPAIAAASGVHHEETLTGFKWIVRPAIAHPHWRFVFGYEEALGFSVDGSIRDKDGISAALAVAALAAGLKGAGQTLLDRLDELSRRFGHHAGRTWSTRFEGHDQFERMAATMRRWRDEPPTALAGVPVAEVRDLLDDPVLPPSDGLVVDLADGSWVVLRPSGTEPKLKVYLEVVVPVDGGEAGRGDLDAAKAAGDERVESLRRAVAESLGLVP